LRGDSLRLFSRAVPLYKTFALGDYYLDGKTAEHSRHIYDLYKLLPRIALDDDFKRLVKEVRNARRAHRVCLSAQEGG
jgi:hypothetical protein